MASSPTASSGTFGCPFLHSEQTSASQSTAIDSGVLGVGEERAPVHYGSYLGIDQLLALQAGPSQVKPGGQGLMHHEEMTFIIVHQVNELWFKLVIGDLRKVRDILREALTLPDNQSQQRRFFEAFPILSRVEEVLRQSTDSFNIIETMHANDFLEFRDYLIPASGFQSASFRVLEALLGVPDLGRAQVNGKAVKEYLTEEERGVVAREEAATSLGDLVDELLSKLIIPDHFHDDVIAATLKALQAQHLIIGPPEKEKNDAMIAAGVENTRSILEDPAAWCDTLVVRSPEEAARFKKAVHAALFVNTYRHTPRFAMLANLLEKIISVEEATLLWRSRHTHMAERLIGRRMGTGGSSGIGYLEKTRQYRVFNSLWLVRKIGVRTGLLPPDTTPIDAPLFA